MESKTDNKPTISISVKSLIELLRTGDLSLGFQAGVRAADGIRYHQAIQKANVEKYADYTPEVPLAHVVEEDDVVLEIGGRVDGIAVEEAGTVIEEIKTTTEDLAALTEGTHPLHWAQAKCYAYMHGSRNGLAEVMVRLTYFQIDVRETKHFTKTFTLAELEAFFKDLVGRYLSWARTLRDWGKMRDASIQALEFPFPGYRAGQRELAVAVYKAIRDGKKLFARAPTGIGKTMATLYPAVKSLAEGCSTKLFYLTAKTVTREIAEKAFDVMRRRGVRLKTITLTAREKICSCPGAACTPDECPCAKGYYDRLGEAIREIFAQDAFTRTAIEACAKAHRLCPFEFSLDLSLWADAIICDYNYVFDPRVYLRRFFDEEEAAPGGAYTFLIDEAHNLVDRSREMFSAELCREPFARLSRSLKGTKRRRIRANRLKALKEAIAGLTAYFDEAGEPRAADENVDRPGGFAVQKEAPEELYTLLRDFARAAEKLLAEKEEYPFREELLERYFEAHRFLRTADAYDERYVTCFTRSDDVRVKLFCMDPAHLLAEALKRGSASVFFSATLQPIEYYMRVLGGEAEDGHLSLPSPFPKENLRVLVDGVPTNYRMRPFTYDRVAEDVSSLVNARPGNYLVYFPSYRYLREIHHRFVKANPEVEVIVQKETMSEQERSAFLETFCTGRARTLAGFAVMGGVFGEGIDLVGDRLSGVVVVGVGLPQISLERDLIRQYYQETLGTGFEYAYVFPGMNKVQQAVGRLIRTETDRGVALLIDERFAWPAYRGLMPPEWLPPARAQGPEGIQQAAALFWRKETT